jgi:dTMP kinase
VSGLFVSLDGPDGGGKTTQAARLAEALRGRGLEVVSCRDPGGTGLGDRLRAILLDRHDTPIGLRAEMLLYMASRAQLVEEIIRPALESGRVVISDRYLLANVVYQGHAGGLPIEEVWAVGRAATGGLMPDLTLLLDLPPELAVARVGASRDRMEDRPASFREAVRAGFLDAVSTYPAPIRVIDAADDAEAVSARIEREVTHALGLPARS